MQQDALISAPEPARLKRVARVLIDSSVPHLDRFFDYEIPPSMTQDAVAGVRVKVPFGPQQLSGFIVEVLEDYAPEMKLRPLAKLVSTQVALYPQIVEAAQAIATRYSGTLWDVVRLAVPARAAKVEKEELATINRGTSREAPNAAGALRARARGA